MKPAQYMDKKEKIEHILSSVKRLESEGMRRIDIELCLALPIKHLTFESLKNLKTSDLSATLTLMNIVGHMPWILKVSAERFDKKVTMRQMMHAAADIIVENKNEP